MSLVIAKAICRREFGTDSVPEQFIDVLRRSSAIELATVIKGNGLPPATKLLKNLRHFARGCAADCSFALRRGRYSVFAVFPG
jgi:hypothetical protein